MSSNRSPLAIVYGGGGPLATAVGMGVADALKAGGLAITDVPAFGTSGGAVAAAATRAGLSHDEVSHAIGQLRLPERRPDHFRNIGTDLFGHRYDPLLWTSVVRLATARRMRLWGGSHPVAAIVAASCAVPLLVPAQPVGPHRYLDGGIRSWVSADLAPAADHLIVVAPVIAPSFGRFGHVLSGQLGYELDRWKRRTGGRPTVIHIGQDIAQRVRRWRHLFDRHLAAEAHAQAYSHVREALSPGGRLHNKADG